MLLSDVLLFLNVLFGFVVKKIDLSITYRSQRRGHVFFFSEHHHCGTYSTTQSVHIKSHYFSTIFKGK